MKKQAVFILLFSILICSCSQLLTPVKTSNSISISPFELDKSADSTDVTSATLEIILSGANIYQKQEFSFDSEEFASLQENGKEITFDEVKFGNPLTVYAQLKVTDSTKITIYYGTKFFTPNEDTTIQLKLSLSSTIPNIIIPECDYFYNIANPASTDAENKTYTLSDFFTNLPEELKKETGEEIKKAKLMLTEDITLSSAITIPQDAISVDYYFDLAGKTIKLKNTSGFSIEENENIHFYNGKFTVSEDETTDNSQSMNIFDFSKGTISFNDITFKDFNNTLIHLTGQGEVHLNYCTIDNCVLSSNSLIKLEEDTSTPGASGTLKLETTNFTDSYSESAPLISAKGTVTAEDSTFSLNLDELKNSQSMASGYIFELKDYSSLTLTNCNLKGLLIDPEQEDNTEPENRNYAVKLSANSALVLDNSTLEATNAVDNTGFSEDYSKQSLVYLKDRALIKGNVLLDAFNIVDEQTNTVKYTGFCRIGTKNACKPQEIDILLLSEFDQSLLKTSSIFLTKDIFSGFITNYSDFVLYNNGNGPVDADSFDSVSSMGNYSIKMNDASTYSLSNKGWITVNSAN